MSAVADTRGLKRICNECGGRFYDLNKRPIVCPGCETEFTGEIKAKTRRGRAAAENTAPKKKEAVAAKAENENKEEGEVEAEENVVSLDEITEENADDANVDGEDDDAIPLDDDDLGAGVESLDDDEEDDLSADIDIKTTKDD